ncbi:MAG: hypothetical protein AAF975_02410 [Spirochaetota bacterium]
MNSKWWKKIGSIGGSIFCILTLLSACSQPTILGYKIVLIQAAESGAVPERKAAQSAIERFNAETKINGLPIELEVLKLETKEAFLSGSAMNWEEFLGHYLDQLQRGKKQHFVVLGFVMGPSANTLPESKQLQQILGTKGLLMVGFWPREFENSEGFLRLNVSLPMYEENEYLLKYMRQERNIEGVYIVYDESYRDRAEDFLSRSQAAGLKNLAWLKYVDRDAPANFVRPYSQGSIKSLSDLLRTQKAPLQDKEQNSAVVLFLNQKNVAESNLYLARSPYRYFFDEFDVYLNGSGLLLEELSNPKTPRYFVVQAQKDDVGEQNYTQFQDWYRRNYHLSVHRELAELYDGVRLLADTAKKTIENNELDLYPQIYHNWLQGQFEGQTGRLTFARQEKSQGKSQGKNPGQRLGSYVFFQWTEDSLQTLGYFSKGFSKDEFSPLSNF